MTITRWLTLLTLSILISGCGVLDYFVLGSNDMPTPAPPVQSVTEPPTLYLLRGDIAFPMDMGSYCWTSGELGLCADMMPPIYTAEMHTLVIGSTLELLFDAPLPDSVSVMLHPGSNLMTRIADIMTEAVLDKNGRLLVTVPNDLDGDYVLLVSAFWAENDLPHGDAFYATPIRFG